MSEASPEERVFLLEKKIEEVLQVRAQAQALDLIPVPTQANQKVIAHLQAQAQVQGQVDQETNKNPKTLCSTIII